MAHVLSGVDVEANYWRMYCAVLCERLHIIYTYILLIQPDLPLHPLWRAFGASTPHNTRATLSLSRSAHIRGIWLYHVKCTPLLAQTDLGRNKKSQQGTLPPLIGIAYLICLIFWTDANLFCNESITIWPLRFFARYMERQWTVNEIINLVWLMWKVATARHSITYALRTVFYFLYPISYWIFSVRIKKSIKNINCVLS